MADQTPIWKVHPLLGTMWKTKNSRFHAADRLRARGWWKGIALSILSAYVLVLSVIPKFIEIGSEGAHRDYIGLVTLAASIIILVFAVIALFDEDKLRYNYMHDNAKAIASLYHEYKLQIDAAVKEGRPQPESATVNERYQALLEQCQFNHDAIDWLKTSIDIGEEEGKSVWWMKFRLVAWTAYDVYFWPCLAMVFPLILACLLFKLMG
ncbi:SLATT domain-containing protein [Asticcacaulis sp. ZE23SCel15]|uniref:SLATT domain-containing protein n=1 Tax=Asticcacaulis sp. ZE23SCel15 TaxID=3059027 RepID=UPI00265FB61D|nr:SLATT domain-containing protein [Asticcacaulis sp. ZE23SCel15]WKL56684.1 SLATT domain-containing protein [Asticcacaulis sp. ZE23SCel15]